MKAKILIYILIFSTLYSCKKRNNPKFERDIIGEWSFMKTENKRKLEKNDGTLPPPPSFEGNMTNGYIFSENGQCENKIGYFERIRGDRREDGKNLFLGNTTKYKIEDDSLGIFDLSKNIWINTKIFSLIGDTLTLQTSDSIFAKYSKKVYKLNENETFDKIVVASTGCFGACPIMAISIEKDGKLCYLGEKYNMINGLFTSDISKTDYLQLENNFKKSNISSLKEHYSAHHTDDEAVTVTFIKNRKIVKTVYDYGRDAPSEFIWAYTLIRYFYQKVKLSPLKADKIYSLVQEISFETKNKVCNLTASECFYLFTELQNGRNINHTFEEKYKIDFWNDQHAAEIVYTDGRFFKFMDKNKRITIDLGYNFLTENNLTNRFKTKKTYQ